LPAALVSQALAKPCILKAETNGELSGAFFGPGLRRWGLSPRSWTVRALLRVRNWGLRRATAFVALSSTIAAELRGHGVAPEAIHVIPNGVDTARFVPATGEERARLRRSLGMAPDDVIFLYTGRLVSYKGLPLLVSVWRNVTERHARLRLVLVGSGGADLHNCEADLRRYVTDHGLAGAVRFAGEVADVVPYLQAADAFVFTGDYDARRRDRGHRDAGFRRPRGAGGRRRRARRGGRPAARRP
jgi:glycosyltransferase involved in cell wall biosynthesis